MPEHQDCLLDCFLPLNLVWLVVQQFKGCWQAVILLDVADMPDPAMCLPHFHHKLALDYFVVHGVVMEESINVGEEHNDGDVVC